MDAQNCLEAKHYPDGKDDGKLVVFTRKQRQIKIDEGQHWELRDPHFEDFMKARIVNTVENPTFVHWDITQPKKRRKALYLVHEKVNGKYRFTKVIIQKWRRDMFFIVTAYRPNYIKESKKGTIKPIYGKEPTW